MASIPKVGQPPALMWAGPELPQINPGVYLVRGSHSQGPAWIREYNRWGLRVAFCRMDEPGEVSCFFNLGMDRAKPIIGRRSKYWAAWTLANGGPPLRHEEMDTSVFRDKMFRAEIGYSKTKDEAARYSLVSKLLEVVKP